MASFNVAIVYHNIDQDDPVVIEVKDKLNSAYTESDYQFNNNNTINTPDFFPELSFSQLPTVLFIERVTNRLITRVSGNAITKETLLNLMNTLPKAELDNTGQFSTEDGELIPGSLGGSGGLFGLSLFNFKLPRFLWAAVAIGSGYKSLDSRNTKGTVGFGAVSAYAAYQYYNQD